MTPMYYNVILILCIVCVSATVREMAVANVTRFSGGDLFTIFGSDCGPTRCMEMSHGTAMSAVLNTAESSGCLCQCRSDSPAFREDQMLCSNKIDECQMASFGRDATKPHIPFVFLPLKGQIIYPSQEIIFTDVEDSICAVTSAQYLSSSGWVTLRDLIDNDVPFGLYRDEGKTFLQWRGSATLHARLEGRLVAAHVLCSAPTPNRLAASCAAFRIAGASRTLDVRSIPFHAGETVTAEPTPQNQGLSVLESLAIGVCVLLLVFVYAAGIVFYVHYKQRQRKKMKDIEMNHNTNTLSTDNGSNLDTRLDMQNVRLKTNPLLQLDSLGSFLTDTGLSDVSEHTEETLDSSPMNTQRKPNVISAMVHTRRKKPSRPSLRASTPERLQERLQRRSASPDGLECAPHSDLSIVDCSIESNALIRQPTSQASGEPVIRRKLYFNPVFFEIEHLKNPPPAAVEFLTKIREVMSIAKEKMTSKRFIPILSDIPEEELYHTVDLGWDIPCARRGRRFSAISLKRENSRRAVHCGGCPGCDSSSSKERVTALTRSNSCKTCVSDDYKQRIVRKWLEEVPSPPRMTRPVKSVAKVSGTPRIIDTKQEEEQLIHLREVLRNEENKTIKISSPIMKESSNSGSDIDSTTKEIKKEQIVKTNDIIIKIEEKEKSQIDVSNIALPNRKDSPVKQISPSQNISRLRKKLPPPPPPPVNLSEPPAKEEAKILPEVKIKMEAVIREFSKCKRAEPKLLEEVKTEIVAEINPKIVIPVLAADSHYFSDDNVLSDRRKRDTFLQREIYDMDSLERSMLKKRRFSLACGPELMKTQPVNLIDSERSNHMTRDRLSQSWRDVSKAMEGCDAEDNNVDFGTNLEHHSLPVSEIFINPTSEPLYNNVPKPGPLTIQVRGSPVESRRRVNEIFDPDTLDRKPKADVKKRVDKIILKSGGSFKCKHIISETKQPNNNLLDTAFSRKIGSLRQIYEAKAKAQEEEVRRSFYHRRGSLNNAYDSDDLALFVRSLKTPDLIRQTENQKDPKPPIPPKQRRVSDVVTKYTNMIRETPSNDRHTRSPEERDRFPPYPRSENINARRSGRRSTRTRSRRTDLRKLYRTEDSGYLSTDSNESKRRARYLMQLHPRTVVSQVKSVLPPLSMSRPPPTRIESDTDELESLCDGRSESGGESVETDSVFFGNFDESKQLFAELGLSAFEPKAIQATEQIDSGFVGETNIVLSGDSDSEHRSVISIVADCDGRASSASVKRIDDPPYMQSIEC